MNYRLQIERIDTCRDDARALLDRLRARLSPRGDIVSEQGRARTLATFGEPLSPQQVVERICRAVQEKGLSALLEFTAKLDGAELTPDTLRVEPAELEIAAQAVEPDYLATVRRVRDRIFAFQRAILMQDITLRDEPGITLGMRYRPLRRVGICVPGGAAAYPSSLLMTVVPAQAAGVSELAVVVPPTAFGGYNAHLLATCHVLGVTEVYRIGGAQAVAALAYGVEGIAPVDKIVGPGNLFVALAKRHVYGEVDIDSIAGPSEVVVIADETAHPDFVAADLISQAEHAPGSSVLLTWHAPLVDSVEQALEAQLAQLSRGDLAAASLSEYGALVSTRDEAETVELTNLLAPEHLHLSVRDPSGLADRIPNAGAIFLGHYAPVAAGDYAAGPSHVLPTGGTARWAGGLSANDFLKPTSLIAIDLPGLTRLAPDITQLAQIESLTAHQASVDLRLRAQDQEHP